MTNSKKIYIKAYTRINLGDDLFIHILCSRYKDTTFYIKEYKPYTDIFKNIPNLHIIDNIDDIKFDAIVYIGGSIFIESAPTSVERVRDLINEIIRDDIPTYIIGANFGPYTSKEYFDTVKYDLIPKLKSITFRDKYSYNLFKDLDNVHYAPDIVFTLDTSNITNIKKKEIGISVIYHLERESLKKHYNDYINKLVEVTKYYISIGYTVKLFSFCRYEKDMMAIDDILCNLTESELAKIMLCIYDGDISEILNELGSLELLLATRFHSTILGLKLKVSTIPICYSNKTVNVLKDLDFNNNIYNFDNIKELKYREIPDMFESSIVEKAVEHFKDLDKYIKNK